MPWIRLVFPKHTHILHICTQSANFIQFFLMIFVLYFSNKYSNIVLCRCAIIIYKFNVYFSLSFILSQSFNRKYTWIWVCVCVCLRARHITCEICIVDITGCNSYVIVQNRSVRFQWFRIIIILCLILWGIPNSAQKQCIYFTNLFIF